MNSNKSTATKTSRVIVLLVTFTAGAVVMALEMLAARKLAPYFGYTIYQWGALIGVALSAMACGYWLGAWLGDSPKAPKIMAWNLAGALLWTCFTPSIAALFLPLARSMGASFGAIVGSLLLVGVPTALLAAVSPIAAPLFKRDGIAETVGIVYMVSTLGSIAGTFFTAFLTIPLIGTDASYFLTAFLLLLALAGAGWVSGIFFLLPVACLPLIFVHSPSSGDTAVFKAESIYNSIRVEDTQTERRLYLNTHGDLNPRIGIQTILPHHGILTDKYYDRFLLGPKVNAGRRVLFLGVAGGTALRQLAEIWPDVSIVGVEVDPVVVDVAKRYFGLSQYSRISLISEEARWFINNSTDKFDIAAVDLYNTNEIPYYCVTVEFFESLQRRLSHDGILMMNIASNEQGDDLLGPVARSASAAFASVFAFRGSNTILLASKSAMTLQELSARLTAPANTIADHVAQAAIGDLRTIDVDNWPTLTDDKNDIEFRSFRMFYGKR